jgi:hypothetical protein
MLRKYSIEHSLFAFNRLPTFYGTPPGMLTQSQFRLSIGTNAHAALSLSVSLVGL